MQALAAESKAKGVVEAPTETSYQPDRKRSWETFNDLSRDTPTNTRQRWLVVRPSPDDKKRTSSELIDCNGFWTCNECSYNVNPISSAECLHCNTMRASKIVNDANDAQIHSSNGAGANDISVVTDGNITLTGTNDKNSEMEEGEWKESDSEQDTTPWACSRCDHFNTKSAFKCGKCKGWKGGKRPTKGSSAKTSKTQECDDNSDGEHERITPWHCGKCNYLNTRSGCKCSECYGWRDGKRPTKSNKAEPAIYDDDEISEDDKGQIESWTCDRLGCGHVNITSTMRCSKCYGWRGGKVPTKKNRDIIENGNPTESDEESTSKEECSKCLRWKEGKRPTKSTVKSSVTLPPILSKNEYKPLFEVNEPVYAPWFSSGQSRAEQTWYPGIIKSYTTVKNGAYGPIRRYDIRFDDGDELEDIEDYCIFSREDYLLTAKKDWIGVENRTDNRSSDPWAKLVGWYEATIGKETYVFSQLYDAMKAHDAHRVGKSGKNSELNLPDDIINKFKSSTSRKKEAKERGLNLPPDLAANVGDSMPIIHSSAYNGVSLVKASGKYQSNYDCKGKKIYLGIYDLDTDAAWAYDECCRQVGDASGNPDNFASKIDYTKTRKIEMKDRGLAVPLSEIQTYIASKISNAVSKASNDNSSSRCNGKKLGDDYGSSSPKYKGVSYIKNEGKYHAFITLEKRLFIGSYKLKSDSAWAYDECCRQIRLPPVNFASKTDYTNARKIEQKVRSLTVPLSEVQTYMTAKVNKIVLKAAAQRPEMKIMVAHDGYSPLKKKDVMKKKRSFSSQYQGVSFNKRQGTYQSYVNIGIPRKKKYGLGSYQIQADAALAVDKCYRQCGLPTVNFDNISEYSQARKKEAEETGIDVPRSEIQAYMTTKINIAVSSASHVNDQTFSDVDLSPSLIQSTEQSELRPIDIQIFASKYNSVYLDKANTKYVAKVYHRKKHHYLGRYELGADAAFAHDECARVLNDNGLSINFATEAEYEAARADELEKRGIDLSRNDVASLIKDQVDKFASAVEKSSHKTHAILSSSVSQVTSDGFPAPIESQTVVSNVTIKGKQFSEQIIPNTTKLILLTLDQIKNLRYPTNTTIWWNEGSNAFDETYKEGTVTAIFFDMNSRDLLYEVLPKNQSESVFFSEHDIAYAPPSLVLVSPDYEDSDPQSARDLINQGEEMLKGKLLLSKRGTKDWSYTVNITDGSGAIKLLEGVPSKCVALQKNSV